jgi:transcriptional regulator with XRE-family HTH domain
MQKDGANPIDVHVGKRVRMRRMMLAMSQEKLGDALGLTFQQVQKYEKGTNRISASRLQQISLVLQVPVPFFFSKAYRARAESPMRRQAIPLHNTYQTIWPRRMGSTSPKRSCKFRTRSFGIPSLLWSNKSLSRCRDLIGTKRPWRNTDPYP